ncbi:hypothetical protein NPIL_558701 [Nephila pilipes]|uniref:Uncharacterized protein n=1 Tax=Nephila pilipes TaxID=299642 RepID=A0A8X6J645_NEPPI|nr:hypothetical protein NPIL_558701 [Nephila pilipes]
MQQRTNNKLTRGEVTLSGRHPIRPEIWRRLGNFTPHQFGGAFSWDRRPYSDGAGLHVDDDNTHQIPADMFGDAASLKMPIFSLQSLRSRRVFLNAQSLRPLRRPDRRHFLSLIRSPRRA